MVHLDIVQNDLPVASDTWHHLDDWDVVEVSSVARRVGTSKGELTCGTSGSKEEGVSRLVQFARFDQSTQRGLHAINRDVIPTHTKDTIELAHTVGRAETAHIVSLCKGVSGNVNAANRHGVC